MKITRVKLIKKLPVKLPEFFTAQVTNSAAADLLHLQPNTIAFFNHNILLVINYYFSKGADELFDSVVELDEIYFYGIYKGIHG